MKRCIAIVTSLMLLFATAAHAQSHLKHFIFFSQEREGIHDSNFYQNPGIAGAQITYPWKRLEPQKDKYDFSAIDEDLAFLQSKGKTLFIQIQDVTFDSSFFAVPPYILKDSAYHGGANSQYEFINDNEELATKAGWVARRWDTAVAARFHQLLAALGKQFDGKIEGINLPESAVDFGSTGRWYPPGFTPATYGDAIKANMLQLKQSFPHSIAIQYANFMPGDTLPDDKPHLKSLYEYAEQIHVGVGGPDIKVYAKWQMVNSYILIHNAYGKTITGVAVQEGNYSVINPQTKRQVSVPDILDFAQNYLRLNYIFWCTEQPFYYREVLPMLAHLKK